MAIHTTLEAHDQDPPNKWTVCKADRYGRRWQLRSSLGDGTGVLDTFRTKRDAENARRKGFIFDLYEKEGRWFRGEHVPGWKPYSVCKIGV